MQKLSAQKFHAGLSLPPLYSITSSARASSVSGPCSGASVRSGAEDEACAGIGAQEFIRYFGLSRLVERLTSAVQWNDVVDVHILDGRELVRSLSASRVSRSPRILRPQRRSRVPPCRQERSRPTRQA